MKNTFEIIVMCLALTFIFIAIANALKYWLNTHADKKAKVLFWIKTRKHRKFANWSDDRLKKHFPRIFSKKYAKAQRKVNAG